MLYQIAANQKGINLVQELISEYSLPVVQAYMYHGAILIEFITHAFLILINGPSQYKIMRTLRFAKCWYLYQRVMDLLLSIL